LVLKTLVTILDGAISLEPNYHEIRMALSEVEALLPMALVRSLRHSK